MADVADPELERLLAEAEAALARVQAHVPAPVDVRDAYGVVRRVERLVRRAGALAVAVASEVDRRRLHVADGHRSARALVEHAANLSSAESGRRMRAVRALRDLPKVAESFADARMGADQVDRIARVHANPRVRKDLIGIDAHLAVAAERLEFDELHQHLTAWEQLTDEDGAADRAARHHEQRAFSTHQGIDGSWDLRGRCGSLQGATFFDVLDHYVAAEREADWAEARARLGDLATVDDLARTEPQRRMDALERMSLDAADAVAHGTGHRITTNIVVDQQTLERHLRRAAGDEPGPDPRAADYWSDLARWSDPTTGELGETGRGHRSTTLDGRPIAPAEALAAALVGHVRRVVLGSDGVVVDMGRTQRLFTGPRRLAVLLSGLACYWIGCHVQAGDCQADHLLPWDAGGRTSPGNGAPACGKHNRFRNHGWTVHRRADGRLEVRRPDGSRLG
ncbi:MAG: DUF222 domain-containing protein [Acidimicrobiales bacterium]